jgi:hypothetical protein
LSRCGAQNGVALTAFTRKLTPGEISALPGQSLPKLRHTATSVDMALPFNLGVLTKKSVSVIDVDIAEEWTSILLSSGSDTASATAIAVLICQLLGNADFAETITPESTPYAAPLLRGKVHEELNSKTGQVAATSSDKASQRVPSDVDRFPPPGFARMFYLPPGQPGFSLVT